MMGASCMFRLRRLAACVAALAGIFTLLCSLCLPGLACRRSDHCGGVPPDAAQDAGLDVGHLPHLVLRLDVQAVVGQAGQAALHLRERARLRLRRAVVAVAPLRYGSVPLMHSVQPVCLSVPDCRLLAPAVWASVVCSVMSFCCLALQLIHSASLRPQSPLPSCLRAHSASSFLTLLSRFTPCSVRDGRRHGPPGRVEHQRRLGRARVQGAGGREEQRQQLRLRLGRRQPRSLVRARCELLLIPCLSVDRALLDWTCACSRAAPASSPWTVLGLTVACCLRVLLLLFVDAGPRTAAIWRRAPAAAAWWSTLWTTRCTSRPRSVVRSS